MKRSTVFLLIILVVVGTGAAAYTRSQAGRRAPAPAKAPEASAFYPTEQLWLVRDITGAIANMAAYANHGPVTITAQQVPKSGNELARFEVTPSGRAPVSISVVDHIWAPAAYAPLASVLMGSARGSCAATDADVAAALTRPTRAVIQRENARVSARLRADMRCAEAHAEAALIVGTMALREAASDFTDARRLISRMTAHLAIADALGAAPDGDLRRLDESLLYTLVGRQRTALERLDAAQPSDAAGRAWNRALRLRNTADWRLVADANQATLLEQIALVRAVDISLEDPRTLDFIDTIHEIADVPDWGRIIMQGHPGVEAGNRFADAAVALELREAVDARADYAPALVNANAEALISELKVEPTAGPVAADGTVWVLDWPMWAAISERHILSTINSRDTHLTSTLGVKEEAQQFRDEVSKTFSGLRLYPLVAILLAPTREEARPGMAGSLQLIQAHPELVTHWKWKTVLAKETWAGLPERVPPLDSWFAPAFPAGTVFDANTRPWRQGPALQFTAATIAPYRTAAPYSRPLCFVSLGGTDYDKVPVGDLRREFARIADYNLDAAKRIADAQKDDPAAYMAAMQKVTDLGPEHLADVAVYSVVHGDLDAARRAYERWFAVGRDEVAIANSSGWMVRDYFERHETAKATALAERAARVYSYRGLAVRADLYDWMGDARSAERYYRMANDRYAFPADLAGFYMRHGRKGIEVDQVMWKVFPGGPVRIALPTLTTAPRDGVSVEKSGLLGERNGIRVGDIIVGIDGIRVQNMWQYYAARMASAEPTVRFVVWRDLRYIEVPAQLRHSWMASWLNNYRPGSGRKSGTGETR